MRSNLPNIVHLGIVKHFKKRKIKKKKKITDTDGVPVVAKAKGVRHKT